MPKFVLFTDEHKWTTPDDVNIKLAFGVDAPSFGRDNPVLFVGANGKNGTPFDSAIAIAWEPLYPATQYEDDVERAISAKLRTFLSGGEICGLAMHLGTPAEIRDLQKQLLCAVSITAPIAKTYHHENVQPYKLYCSAIEAAGTVHFADSLRLLTTWFQPPDVPAHQILLRALPNYLSGSNLGTEMPGTDEEWEQLGQALESQLKGDGAKVAVKAAMHKLQEEDSSRISDWYPTLCRAMMTLIADAKA
jgi:hypothetical protein